MSLQKSLFALLILTITSSVSSTSCGTNPLLDVYGITAAFTDAQVVSGLTYCKSLQGKETCCDADTINGFQSKADELIKSLTSAVAKRDKALLSIRKDTLPSLSGKLASLKEASSKAVAKLEETLANGGSGDMGTDLMNAIVMAMAMAYGEMAKMLTDNLSSVKSGLPDYQKARTACVIDIVKIQAAAWCLACDPEFTTKGVSLSGIEFSSNLKQTLTDSCFAYFTAAATQSMLFSMNVLSSQMSAITAALNKVAKGNANGANEFMTAFMTVSITEASLDASAIPVGFPDDCDEDECEWIPDTLFKGGELDEASLTLGGAVESNSGESGGLVVNGANRILTAGSWDPDADEAGVTVAFEDNPGNVDNNSDNSAGLFKNVVGGLVVLLSVLLI